MGSAASTSALEKFHWSTHPAAAAMVDALVQAHLDCCAATRTLANRLNQETGTRLHDWIDHIGLASNAGLERQLVEAGFRPGPAGTSVAWRHPEGMFPTIYLDQGSVGRLALRVESVSDFLTAHQLDCYTQVDGQWSAPLRKAKVFGDSHVELWVIERHGCVGLDCPEVTAAQLSAAERHLANFDGRRRAFADEREGFEHAIHLIDRAAHDLSADWACDLFFRAERNYWQGRNRAAQVQKARQDALGLGWANHDHHTYRSSREHFAKLIHVLEHLGFECRERFYAGHDAGWGAQVLEHPRCGIVIFADVDLTPDDVLSDFAHELLEKGQRLGTVGLWCGLHGEAFLEAGMHHLECQFHFDWARSQLTGENIATMKPFTDFPHLKQAFTEGEMWPVARERVEQLRAAGLITHEQAQEFLERGAVGSHLEILQRNEGYKGFNQTGISEIITATDPRHGATSPGRQA